MRKPTAKKSGANAEAKHPWAKGGGMSASFVTGHIEPYVTARPRAGTEQAPEVSERVVRQPERDLAAAVLGQAARDAYGKGRTRCTAIWFLTDELPSLWARQRQLFTAALGIDDDYFRARMLKKLRLEDDAVKVLTIRQLLEEEDAT